jgi:hypothetical protein
MTDSDDGMEGLISLFEAGDLDPELAEKVAQQVENSPSARKLLASFCRLSELCGMKPEEEPVLPEVVSERVLEELQAHLDREGLGCVEEGGRGQRGSTLDEKETPEVLPEVLTVAEVARYLRVTREELNGELEGMPFFEFAGGLRMRRESLLSWIEDREAWSRRQKLLSLPGSSLGG